MTLEFNNLRLALAAACAAALLAGCGGGASSGAPSESPASVARAAAPDAADKSEAKTTAANNVYIVELAEAPAVIYQGGIRGQAATRPAKGKKIDPDSAVVRNYMGYLSSRHDAVLAGVGGGRKLHGYGYVFNGFAAELTDAQAQKLAQTPGVVAVSKDEKHQMQTSSTPGLLGLSGPGGFWESHAKGEGVVIGIVDSGIWPEHPSVSDRTGSNGSGSQGGKLDYRQIPGWHGKCAPGEQFNASNCNQKLIGARYYNAGFGGNAAIKAAFPFEYNSPRDWGGHGTHTSTTAGGNAGTPATGEAAVFGSVNGIAPRARIATYKVCWADEPTGGGCFGSDSVAAIDQAVADGVDVINFSISGTTTNFRDPVEIAFLRAAAAGVFVAASAGNSGPTTSTVAHPSPWLTTVAAGTHNRNGEGSVTINGATYFGASVASAVGPVLSIDSIDAGLAGADPAAVALCFAAEDNGGTPVLDPAKVAGKIVICDRGVTARVNKSLAVKEAGGAGMILVNTSPSSINADFHFVPTVHLQDTDRDAVKLAAGNAATIAAAQIVFNVPAPTTASFSSRGPLRAGIGDLLKPDLMAPGQDILAGVAPPGNRGRLFDLYSGTSMSSPHVAGLAALMKELHPGWSPMAIKSALMTSAGDVLDGPNTNPLVIFRQGAGHVQPSLAANPGLVFDSGYADWLGFLCGTQLPASFCTDAGVPVLDPSDLNVASIAIGDLPGAQTVTRRVTNVGGNPATYTASVSGMAGFTVAVSPSTLMVPAGATKSFTVTITRTGAAPLNVYAGGQLTWSTGTTKVRVPVVVRPVVFAAPVEVSGSYPVSFGYDGDFGAAARGLIPALTFDGAVGTNAAQDFPVIVAAGATYARFSLFDANVSPASDLDMEVYGPSGNLVGASGSGSSAEEVNLTNPTAGTYTVRIVGYAVPTAAASFKLFTWALGSTAAGNMSVVAPSPAVLGTKGSIELGFSGLSAGTKYLGSVVYSGTTGLPNPTIVRVDP